MRGVVHCFTGTPAQARVLCDEFGLFLGIGGVLTFPKAESVRDAVRDVEGDVLFPCPAEADGSRVPAAVARVEHNA